MAIKNIIAAGIGFTPGSVKFIPTLGFSVGTRVWTTAGSFTYVAADWLYATFKLRAHMKTTSGTAYARIYNDTGAAELVEMSTTGTSLGFVTSAAATLVDGSTYTVQFGAGAGIDCKWRSFDVYQDA